MKFDITLADLALVDTETGEEILDFGELFVPNENCEAVDPFVKMPERPSWMECYDEDDTVILGEEY